MKLEHQALLQTTGIILGIIAAGVLMTIITANMSLETGMYLAGAVFFAIFFRLIYNVVLDRLWMGQHLKDYDKSA